jgi:hypothetical protein
MKKIKRSVLIGGPMDAGDEKNNNYKVMECNFCKKNIIMMKKDWEDTINPEKTMKVCCFCVDSLCVIKVEI